MGRSMWRMSKLNDWRNEFLAKNCGVKLRRTKYELSSVALSVLLSCYIVIRDAVYHF